VAPVVLLSSQNVAAWEPRPDGHADSYDEGWDAGWEAAYKERGKMAPLPPLAPPPPLPKLGDDRSDFERGYLDGIRRAQERRDNRD